MGRGEAVFLLGGGGGGRRGEGGLEMEGMSHQMFGILYGVRERVYSKVNIIK